MARTGQNPKPSKPKAKGRSEVAKKPNSNVTVAKELKTNVLRRFCQRAGVKRISRSVPEELRIIAVKELGEVLRKAAVYMKIAQRKTIMVADVSSALKELGIHLGAADNILGGSVVMTGRLSIPKSQKNNPKHRFRAGTVSMREISKAQASDLHIFSKAPFVKFVRRIANENGLDKNRFSEKAIMGLMLFLEDRLVHVCQQAYVGTIHQEQVTLKARDIVMAQHLLCMSRGSGCDKAIETDPRYRKK